MLPRAPPFAWGDYAAVDREQEPDTGPFETAGVPVVDPWRAG